MAKKIVDRNEYNRMYFSAYNLERSLKKRRDLKQRAEDIFEALSLTIIPTKLEILLKIMELIESM